MADDSFDAGWGGANVSTEAVAAVFAGATRRSRSGQAPTLRGDPRGCNPKFDVGAGYKGNANTYTLAWAADPVNGPYSGACAIWGTRHKDYIE